MHKAIVHIGTEKTGTTSIQSCLCRHHRKLGKLGYLFPRSAGVSSNFKLVLFCKDDPEPNLLNLARIPLAKGVDDEWRSRFLADHEQEVRTFQRKRDDSLVIYSSEHLQSRLNHDHEVERLADLLAALYDEVEILVYLRRQDRYALSAYSTALRGGSTDDFDFASLNASGPYYDYRMLLDRWGRVFGDDRVRVRLFESAKLHQGDVVADFLNCAGIDRDRQRLTLPEPKNEALSWTAQQMLLVFNRLALRGTNEDSALVARLRPDFLRYLEGVSDDYGKVMPSRQAAQAFLERFEDDNRLLFDRWLPGQGFDRRFTEYPAASETQPLVEDAESRVWQWLDSGEHESANQLTRMRDRFCRRLGARAA